VQAAILWTCRIRVDDVPVDKIKDSKQAYEYLTSRKSELMGKSQGKALTNALTAELKAAVTEFSRLTNDVCAY